MWKITDNRGCFVVKRWIREETVPRFCLARGWIGECKENSVCAIEQGISYDDFEQIQQLQLSYQLGQLRQNTKVVDRSFTFSIVGPAGFKWLVISSGRDARFHAASMSYFRRNLVLYTNRRWIIETSLTEVQSRPIRFYFRRISYTN